MKNLTPDLYEKACLVLARDISLSEEESVNSFFEFSDLDIREFQLLGEKSSILVVSYIRFRLQGNVALSSVMSYCSSVVQKGMPVSEWYALLE
ncbi:hypothetical protein [Massilia rubra]|uniref:Uncharacterized protein n=1 Tax=Massilia rubra TaxID=2607910 RepID=A0ABX0LZG4_9BURK|nr:hypothetical protein [Massilia rubra]NHZ36754.1 hypothetical protein [Massilia rubra]